MSLPPLIEAMRDPGFYPHRPEDVRLTQTHISYVFLAGSEVYKVKKPVTFRFLDFSTREARRHFCREEVRLNRRLAPDTYLGVVAVRPRGGRYEITAEEDSAAVEYAVHMRRLPEERFLTRLLELGEVTGAMIDRLAERLVSFHAAARSDARVAAQGAPSEFARVIEETFASTRPFRDESVSAADDDRIQSFCRAFIDRERPRLENRAAEGRVREGHGDLHGEHVCFTDPLVIFDCIEFSESLRCCDVASEIAFLAMDLAFRRRDDLADRFVARYAASSGDSELPRLVRYYACYRAYVRGMVDSLAAGEPEVGEDERPRLWESARRHFRLAYRYTWTERPCLVVIAGLSGTGKSTLAAALAERTGFRRWSSDVVRKRLAGLDPLDRVDARQAMELYSASSSARTYETLYAEAERELSSGLGAILDATFLRRIDRDRARDLAKRSGRPVLIVECRADEEEVLRRLQRRAAAGDDPSDANAAIYREQRRTVEPVGPGEPATLVADLTAGIAAASDAVEKELLRITEPRRR